MKKHIIILFLLTSVLFSCKKEKAVEPETTTPINYTDGSASDATVYSGILKSLKVVSITGSANTIQYSFNSPSAYFSVSPTQYLNSVTAVQVDSVLINDSKLQYGTYSYSSLSSTVVYPPSVWKVYGNNGIQSFTYTNAESMPDYTGYNQYPDSINKANNYVFNVSGLSGFGIATLILSDGTNGSGHYVSKTLSSTTTSITITANEMAAMNTVSNAIFSIVLVKNNARYFGNKSFNFPSEAQFTKTIKLY